MGVAVMNTLNHLAIIADGNGRWAEGRGLTRSEGHEHGLHKMNDIVRWCVDFGIPYLSMYVFSTENWKRPKEEVDALCALADRYFDRHQEFKDNNVKVLVSGCADNLKSSTLDKIAHIQEETVGCTGLVLNLCANYGGRREIVDAISKGARTEEEITAALYHQLPPPDVILRTGGHQRLSNFLLWQSAYAELYFTHTLFPDLSKGELRYIKRCFENETRKFGGVLVDQWTV
jgi:undecaprenyl diphosphate synthase